MLPTAVVLKKIGLIKGESFADIGCGIGYFAIPVAEIIGHNGIVYALDVQEEMLEELIERSKVYEIRNIKTIITGKYDFKIDDNLVSHVFMSTVLHEIADKRKFIVEAKRILVTGGKIVVVEWIKKETIYGPPATHRIANLEVEKLLCDLGFKDVAALELNEYFYLVTGTIIKE